MNEIEEALERFTRICKDTTTPLTFALEALTRCLSEGLVLKVTLPEDEWFRERARTDGLDKFMERLSEISGRNWDQAEAVAVRDLIDRRFRNKVRIPLDLGTRLAMIFNRELECAICGAGPPETELHIDHIYPWSRGGTSDLENLRFLCALHNLEKADKIGYDFKK